MVKIPVVKTMVRVITPVWVFAKQFEFGGMSIAFGSGLLINIQIMSGVSVC